MPANPSVIVINGHAYVERLEAARRLDRNPRSIYNYVNSGSLHVYRLPGDRLHKNIYLVSEVEALAERLNGGRLLDTKAVQ